LKNIEITAFSHWLILDDRNFAVNPTNISELRHSVLPVEFAGRIHRAAKPLPNSGDVFRFRVQS
jgi:hypothetical protein